MTFEYRKKFKEYTRLSKYLKPDEYILIADPSGVMAYMKISFAEPMGHFPILFADEFNAILAKGARVLGGQPAAPTPSGDFIEFEFLTPNRYNRLIQARPIVFALYRPLGALANLAGQLVPAQPEFADVFVQWSNPFQSVRGGSDKPANVRININAGNSGIPQAVGGAFGGVMNANDVYARDDPNEDYDIFVMSGIAPGYRILNNHPTFPIGGGLTDNTRLDFDWYLDFVGFKYVMEPVSDEEYNKLKNHELPYHPIVVGGVPQSSAIRGGGK